MKNLPILHSEPILAQAPALDKSRAQLLKEIESGELEYIDVPAIVFKTGKNANHVTFNPSDLHNFAASFKNQPFLRNHEQYDINARDGIIESAELDEDSFIQTLRITTRQGMTDYVEGRIDRFSIGWHYKDILCTVCNLSWFACTHSPGKDYDTTKGKKTCELLFTEPHGKETSAVNSPAVQGTGLLQALQDYKLSLNESAPSSALIANKPTRKNKGAKMPKKNAQLTLTPSPEDEEDDDVTLSPAEQRLEDNRRASEVLLGAQERQNQLNQQVQAGERLLIAQCQNLLTTGLQSSRLPKVTQDRIEKQFKARVFNPSELSEAIEDARKELEVILSPSTIQGPARVSSMFNSNDQVQASLDDLLGAPREDGMNNLKVHKTRSIRQAYLDMTGDFDFVGGYYGDLAQLASSFPAIVVNAMNKILVASWKKYGEAGYDWWKDIVTVEHFDNVTDIDWIITGTIGSLPVVAKGAEYTELATGDNKERSSWSKYGGYVGIALEDILNDNIRAFRNMPDQVALGGIRNISEQVAYIFTQASAAGPTLSDGGALFNATAVTTAGGHANLRTTALGTDFTEWEAIASAMYNQPMHIAMETGLYGTGKKQALDPKYILVPRALRGQANNLFVQRQPSVTTNSDWYGEVKPLTVPEWTDATDFAAVIDPVLLKGLMIGEIFGVVPQLYLAGGEQNPAMFSNDENRIKVRQFLNVGVANLRALHKSNVA